MFVVCLFFYLLFVFFFVVCKNYYIINIYKYIISYQMVLSNGAQRFEPVGLGSRKRRTMRGGFEPVGDESLGGRKRRTMRGGIDSEFPSRFPKY